MTPKTQVAERTKERTDPRQIGVVGLGGIHRRKRPLQESERVGRGRLVEYGEGHRTAGRAEHDDGGHRGDVVRRQPRGVPRGRIRDDSEPAAQAGERREDALEPRRLPHGAVRIAGGQARVGTPAERNEPLSRGRGRLREALRRQAGGTQVDRATGRRIREGCGCVGRRDGHVNDRRRRCAQEFGQVDARREPVDGDVDEAVDGDARGIDGGRHDATVASRPARHERFEPLCEVRPPPHQGGHVGRRPRLGVQGFGERHFRERFVAGAPVTHLVGHRSGQQTRRTVRQEPERKLHGSPGRGEGNAVGIVGPTGSFDVAERRPGARKDPGHRVQRVLHVVGLAGEQGGQPSLDGGARVRCQLGETQPRAIRVDVKRVSHRPAQGARQVDHPPHRCGLAQQAEQELDRIPAGGVQDGCAVRAERGQRERDLVAVDADDEVGSHDLERQSRLRAPDCGETEVVGGEQERPYLEHRAGRPPGARREAEIGGWCECCVPACEIETCKPRPRPGLDARAAPAQGVDDERCGEREFHGTPVGRRADLEMNGPDEGDAPRIGLRARARDRGARRTGIDHEVAQRREEFDDRRSVVTEHALPVRPHRSQRVLEELDEVERRYGGVGCRRLQPQQLLQHGAHGPELSQQIAGHVAEGRADRIGHGIRSGEIECRIRAGADRDAVGGENEDRAALLVQRDADANRLHRRIPREDRRPARRGTPDRRVEGQAGQGRRRSRGRVEAQQFGLALHAEARVRHRHGEHGGHDGLPAGPRGDANAQREGCTPQRESNFVADERGPRTQQIRDLPQPRRAMRLTLDDLPEPRGEGLDALRRQFVDRQRGNRRAAAEAQHAGQRRELTAPQRIGLGLDETQHQLEGGVVEIRDVVERQREIARLGASRHLELPQGQGDRRRTVAGVGRHAQSQADATEMRLTRARRTRVDGDLGVEPDDAAALAEKQDVTGRPAVFRGLEEGHAKRGPRLRRRREQPEADADTDVVGRRFVQDEEQGEARILVADEREPDESLGVRLLLLAAQYLVQELDHSLALVFVRQDRSEVVAGATQPVGLEVTITVDESDRLGQTAEFVQIRCEEAHRRLGGVLLWRVIVSTRKPPSEASSATGIRGFPSLSRPHSSARDVTMWRRICHANAVRDSPQTSITAARPRGRVSVAAISPVGRASVPTASATCTSLRPT
jgi:hypothetical protein